MGLSFTIYILDKNTEHPKIFWLVFSPGKCRDTNLNLNQNTIVLL